MQVKYLGTSGCFTLIAEKNSLALVSRKAISVGAGGGEAGASGAGKAQPFQLPSNIAAQLKLDSSSTVQVVASVANADVC
jgi:hypothetical protein